MKDGFPNTKTMKKAQMCQISQISTRLSAKNTKYDMTKVTPQQNSMNFWNLLNFETNT